MTRFATIMTFLLVFSIGLMAASPPGTTLEYTLSETGAGIIYCAGLTGTDVGVITPTELNEKQIAIVTADQFIPAAADIIAMRSETNISTLGAGTSADRRSPVGARTMSTGDQLTNASVALRVLLL